MELQPMMLLGASFLLGVCIRDLCEFFRHSPDRRDTENLRLSSSLVDFVDAAKASRGDVVILRSAKVLSKVERESLLACGKLIAGASGVRLVILEPHMEIAQLFHFRDKGAYGNDRAYEPLPMGEVKVGGDVREPR